VTKSLNFTKEVHIHPRNFLQTVQLSDGSMIQIPSLSPHKPFIEISLDSLNHPSWNPKLRSNQQLLDEQGSVSKFKKRFGTDWTLQPSSVNEDIESISEDNDVSKELKREVEGVDIKDLWSGIESNNTNKIKPGKLEAQAFQAPKKPSTASSETPKKQDDKKKATPAEKKPSEKKPVEKKPVEKKK
jgi:ribosomal protein L31